MDGSKDKIIASNELEFGEFSHRFKWITPAQAQEASRQRSEILSSLEGKVTYGFCGTKLDCSSLSPGCILCGTGGWSCLFINGICNAGCFYCPAEQKSKSRPMTAGLEFENPQDYVGYLERMGIKGVGLSGGEPFLTFERTLLFASKIKRRFGEGIYLWIYTNGIAVTPDGLKSLKDAGLDEIRFDLSAVEYDTSRIELAADIIDTVTVEMPAIPEHVELLQVLMGRLPELGVRYLNLHQLRVTHHNCMNLAKRGYTFVHGDKVTVLESEQAALSLVRYSKEKGLSIPVNYCSFAYRNRFQTRGQRRRLAELVKKTFEDVTAAGAIRRMTVKGKPEVLEGLESSLREISEPGQGWFREPAGEKISIRARLWKHIPPGILPTHVSYYIPVLLSNVSYSHPFEKIVLNRKRSLYIERRPAQEQRELSETEALMLLNFTGSEEECCMDCIESRTFPYERIPFGLDEYF